jgi:hypothetical protein
VNVVAEKVIAKLVNCFSSRKASASFSVDVVFRVLSEAGVRAVLHYSKQEKRWR